MVYVRKDPLERHKFDAAASPALFAGWRFDPGPKSHKNAHYILDYDAVKSQKSGYNQAIAIACEEVYVPDGPPVLPLKAAADEALSFVSRAEARRSSSH